MEIQFSQLSPTSFQTKDSNTPVWGADLVLKENNVYQIIASSGSGKTTLVSILAGLRGDYEGGIVIDGKLIQFFTPLEWSVWRSKTASFVFQDLRLFPELSAIENILLSGYLSEDSSGASSFDVESMAKKLDIFEKLNIKVKFLSFGQMQRVAIIRALARPYRWIILDEPFSHLDQQNATVAWQLILNDAKNKNAGIVITSLDPYTFIQPDQIFVL